MFTFTRTKLVLKELEALLKCSSCGELLENPCCLGVCDHIFCQRCVVDHAGNECPVCRVPCHVKDMKPDRQLADLLTRFRKMVAIICSNEVCLMDGSAIVAEPSLDIGGSGAAAAQPDFRSPPRLPGTFRHTVALVATSEAYDSGKSQFHQPGRSDISDHSTAEIEHNLRESENKRCFPCHSPSPEIFTQSSAIAHLDNSSLAIQGNVDIRDSTCERVCRPSTKCNQQTLDKQNDRQDAIDISSIEAAIAEYDENTEIIATPPQYEQYTISRCMKYRQSSVCNVSTRCSDKAAGRHNGPSTVSEGSGALTNKELAQPRSPSGIDSSQCHTRVLLDDAASLALEAGGLARRSEDGPPCISTRDASSLLASAAPKQQVCIAISPDSAPSAVDREALSAMASVGGWSFSGAAAATGDSVELRMRSSPLVGMSLSATVNTEVGPKDHQLLTNANGESSTTTQLHVSNASACAITVIDDSYPYSTGSDDILDKDQVALQNTSSVAAEDVTTVTTLPACASASRDIDVGGHTHALMLSSMDADVVPVAVFCHDAVPPLKKPVDLTELPKSNSCEYDAAVDHPSWSLVNFTRDDLSRLNCQGSESYESMVATTASDTLTVANASPSRAEPCAVAHGSDSSTAVTPCLATSIVTMGIALAGSASLAQEEVAEVRASNSPAVAEDRGASLPHGCRSSAAAAIQAGPGMPAEANRAPSPIALRSLTGAAAVSSTEVVHCQLGSNDQRSAGRAKRAARAAAAALRPAKERSAITSKAAPTDTSRRSVTDPLSVYDFVPSQQSEVAPNSEGAPKPEVPSVVSKRLLRNVVPYGRKRTARPHWERVSAKIRVSDSLHSTADAPSRDRAGKHVAPVAPIGSAVGAADSDAVLPSRMLQAAVSGNDDQIRNDLLACDKQCTPAALAQGELVTSAAATSAAVEAGRPKKCVRFSSASTQASSSGKRSNEANEDSAVQVKRRHTKAANNRTLSANVRGVSRDTTHMGTATADSMDCDAVLSSFTRKSALRSVTGVNGKLGSTKQIETPVKKTQRQGAPVLNVGKRNPKGETALHKASIKGDSSVVTLLLKKGADANARDNAGWTPLHEAAIHGHRDIMKLLLDGGAHVNAPGADNDTPLHDAVSSGHVACVQLLVEYGASLMQHNVRGLAAADLATTEEMKAALLNMVPKESPHKLNCTSTPSRRRPQQAASAAVTVAAVQSKPLPRYVLLSTGLKREQRATLTRCAALLRGSCADELTTEVTHVVTATNDAGLCPRTMKFLLAILAGKWIVCYDWAKTCVERGRHVAEVQYEVQGCSSSTHGAAPSRARLNLQLQHPKLFDGCSFYFFGTFAYPTPGKEELAALVAAGGGLVVHREPRRTSNADLSVLDPASVGGKSCHVPFHATSGTMPYGCPFFFVRDSRSCVSNDSSSCGDISSSDVTVPAGWCLASAGWLLDCVANYKLLDVFT